MDSANKYSAMFSQLVLMLHAASMQHLGKLKHPGTDTIERNLDAARAMIDMIEMLKVKSQGNLNADETRFLAQVLQELQLNYVDEVQKDQKGRGEQTEGQEQPGTAGKES
jgi:hypothetical protein